MAKVWNVEIKSHFGCNFARHIYCSLTKCFVSLLADTIVVFLCPRDEH
jgi:hypothetical protein